MLSDLNLLRKSCSGLSTSLLCNGLYASLCFAVVSPLLCLCSQHLQNVHFGVTCRMLIYQLCNHLCNDFFVK